MCSQYLKKRFPPSVFLLFLVINPKGWGIGVSVEEWISCLLKDRAIIALKQMPWIINVWTAFAVFKRGTEVPMEEVSRTNLNNSKPLVVYLNWFPSRRWLGEITSMLHTYYHCPQLRCHHAIYGSGEIPDLPLAKATAGLAAAYQTCVMPKLVQLA